MNKFYKSLIAPIGISEKKNYYIMNDQYIRNYLVTRLPEVFSLGMLSYHTGNPNIKVFTKTDMLDMDIAASLRKELKEKEEMHRKSRDEILRSRLEKEVESIRNYIQEITYLGDRTLNVIIVFSISADSLEKLNSLSKDLVSDLRLGSIFVTPLLFHQLDLMKELSPLFIQNDFSPTVKRNLGVPITSLSFAGMWPYTFQTLKDKNGFIYARERHSSGMILWNPMLYLEDKNAAVEQNRLSANIVIVGGTGSGKTTDIQLIIRNMIKNKYKIVWQDPEDKNERLTKKYGGTYVKWGEKGSRINIFDLKPVTVDEDSQSKTDPYNTKVAIYNVIDEFKSVLRLYKPNISDTTVDIVSELVIELYQRKGITFETNFRPLVATDYPILSDFNRLLIDKIELSKLEATSNTKMIDALEDLKMKISPMLIEHEYFFDGHTTIQFDNILSFGTRVLFNKPIELRNALNYIMFSFIKALCLNPNIKSATIFDEAHMYLNEGKAAEEVSTIWRRARKYSNVSVIGTQETKDFDFNYGKAIFNNSPYKIIKFLQKDAITSLKNFINLNENEVKSIESFKRGDALFVAGNQRFEVSVILTDKEQFEFEGQVSG